MARRPSQNLTEAELRVMRVLWSRKQATVGEVLEHLEDDRTPAYNTILTILGILERKGYVTHTREGRAFTYLPLVEQREARQSALSQILHRFFDDSRELLVLDLLGHEQTNSEELRRVRELLKPAPQLANERVRKRRRRS
jgi:BlaI family transcriptional regulator, penicillinase repressor